MCRPAGPADCDCATTYMQGRCEGVGEGGRGDRLWRSARTRRRRIIPCSRVFTVVWFVWIGCCLALVGGAAAADADPALREQAAAAMRKAAEYYRGKVARHGGYVYYYSPDLKQRQGEGVAGAGPDLGAAAGHADRRPGVLWPPIEATGDKFYLDAARDAGRGADLRPAQVGRLDQTASISIPRAQRRPVSQRQRQRHEQLDARRRHLAVGDPLHGAARPGARIQGRGSPRIGADRPRCAAQGPVPQRRISAGLDRPRLASSRS